MDYIQPTRNFSLSYLLLDCVCLIVFLFLLFKKKRYVILLWSLFGGVLYWIVDYGYFYLLSNSRAIYILVGETSRLASNLETCLVLLWMSLSYGILDFAFIWLWLDNDEFKKEFTALIVVFWATLPLTSSIFDNNISNMIRFQTTRSTSKYHGAMALIMLVGYILLISYNLFVKEKEKRAPIFKIFWIGFFAQFLWEFFLLVFNIRSSVYEGDMRREILTLLQDSLIETNLGLPYMFFIHRFVSKKVTYDLKRIS